MKLLVIGGGGREHALAWKLAHGKRVQKVYVAPGNAGTATEDGLENLDITQVEDLVAFAKKNDIHLTVVGPEAPLSAGVVDVFQGAGLMIDKAGNPKTLEFNCRMGDPETQPIILRLKSDLLELLEHAVDGKLDAIEAQWDRRAALGVVLAAHGYPEEPRKGDRIEGLPKPSEDCRVFHAGTRLEGGKPVTNGGRVLCVTALGHSVRSAVIRVYEAIQGIRFDGMQYRKDIGHRAIKRK